MPNLTLEEIGRQAGVSRSTVSRVINNHESVSPEVRARVLQVVEETGYRPHPAARSLAARRTQVLGLVLPHTLPAFFVDLIFPRLMRGITQACNTHGYSLSLFMFHAESEEKELVPRLLTHGLIDGVLFFTSIQGDPLLSRLRDTDLPYVTVGRPLLEGSFKYVDVDNVAGMHNATTHLIRRGRRRIGHIAAPCNTSAGQDRRQGYRDALAARGLPAREEWVVEGDFTETGGYLAARKLMAANVDALVVASDRMALGALRALRELGKRVPAAVAVVGFGDLDAATLAHPALTTVRHPIRKAGVMAVEILLDVIDHGREPAQHVILPTQLIVRDSCGTRL
jgi:LacI family transcriptional regulator